MNDRNQRLNTTICRFVCAVMLCGGFTACQDRFELDEPDNIPTWLGNSIYEELKNPKAENLSGTFNNFVHLIDDLGYAEVLGKTGSKTLFPANDEAFERFFQNNQWGVSKYEDLTETMKKQLLFTAMLDNAILVEMLSNVSDDAYSSGVGTGVAMKHTTGVTTIDSVTYVPNREGLPQNNSYWDKFGDNGIYMVMDNTRPMMVHFTAEQMIRNSVTVTGENSDFEVITGMPYNEDEKSTYIFRNKIINADVTCKNGYIHQLGDVLVPPGNLAELLRTNGESNYFSRMLDRFSAPYYDAATTRNYNDAALVTGTATIDSIFQKRYFSQRSQGAALTYDPNGNNVQWSLDFDPGWNTYNSGEGDDLSDLAAIFVPTDEAMKQYFLPGGSGTFLIDQYGTMPNTEENLTQNIDSIPISIVQAFVRNLMKSSFLRSVPSKFNNVMDDASDPMGLTTEHINRNADGTFDVKIANNGVAYMLNTVFAPNRYVAVSAPALLSDDMKIMNIAINDGDNGNSPLGLNLNFYAYLLAMGANYAFFIPTDDAFKKFYVDPARLQNATPRALRFYPIAETPYVGCSAWAYDPVNNVIVDSIGTLRPAEFKSQLIDILNYHTIVLSDGEVMGQNKYYKTKHGGEVLFDNSQVRSGAQIDNDLDPSGIIRTYNQKNGTTYAIDHLIQAPQKSVYAVLSDSVNHPQFYDFFNLCLGFSNEELMEFASDRMMDINTVTKRRRMDGYLTFIAKNGLTDNVNYFNSYNYTVWAPDNEAMQKAYANGLPHWSDVTALYEKWADLTDGGLIKWATLLSGDDVTISPYEKTLLQADRDKALAMIEEINTFIRYHFQDNAIYADNVVESNEYATASADTLGIRKKLNVTGGGGVLRVNDTRGNTITISANDSNGKMVNQMTRDYVFNTLARVASSISTSSFAVIHQVSTPFNSHADTDRYDALWTGSTARKKLAAFRQLYESELYKRY